MPSRYTLDEQETILRWDQADKRVIMYTASPVVAAQWAKKGYALATEGPAEEPNGWRCLAPAGSVTVRSVKTTPSGPQKPRKLAGAALKRHLEALAGRGQAT